jgi:type IV fimbrial biogenesis protein FimT
MRGFTLIELMVTLAIMAVLMKVAAPGMQTLYKSSRVQTEVSQFIGDIQFAKAEAIKRGQPVTMCPSSDGNTCLALGTTTWGSGWIVFNDVNGNGVLTAGVDNRLRQRAPFRGGDTLTPSNNVDRITFNREGFSTTPSTSTIFKLHTSDSLSTATRCVTLEFAGRTSTQIYGQVNSSSVTCN